MPVVVTQFTLSERESHFRFLLGWINLRHFIERPTDRQIVFISWLFKGRYSNSLLLPFHVIVLLLLAQSVSFRLFSRMGGVAEHRGNPFYVLLLILFFVDDAPRADRPTTCQMCENKDSCLDWNNKTLSRRTEWESYPAATDSIMGT